MNSIDAINHVNNSINFKKVSYPVFRSESDNKTDTVELSTKKNDDHKYKEYALDAIAGLATLAFVSTVLVKGMHKKVENLYKEKLVLSNLPEKIEFKAAKTIEEAKKFTKEILGIKKVDDNFTLEALNYANKSIVDVSNVNKGKLYMPSALKYKQMEDDTLAYVNASIHSADFGELAINKNFFNEEYLDKYLKEKYYFKNGGKNLFTKDEITGNYVCNGTMNSLRPYLEEPITPILDKYYANPNSLSFYEKLTLKATMKNIQRHLDFKLSQNHYFNECKKIAKENNMELPFEEWACKKTVNEREKFLRDMFAKLSENGILLKIDVNKGNPESTIYHEMGHLQDFGKNLKDIDLKQMETSNPNLINNRWGGIEYEECLKIWDKDKNEFKKRYPDLYEFLTNEQNQETAGRISSYAQSGIGEYIAEVYAKMVDKKLNGGSFKTDDIMALYKKHNGPMLAE